MMKIYHAEAFLKRKEKYIFFFYLFFERKTVATCFVRDLRRGFLNENHPEQFALRLHEASWVLRITGYEP